MRNDQHFTRGFAGQHLVLPLTQHGINSLDPGFALFSGGVEFIEQAAGAEFWEGVNGKQRAVMLFQRIAKLRGEIAVVAKERSDACCLALLFQQTEHILMIRNKKIT